MSTIIDATIGASTNQAPSTSPATLIDANSTSTNRKPKVDARRFLLKGNRRGIAPIYTPERRAEIIEAFEAGLAPHKAAQVAGISEATLKAWFKREPKFGVECARLRAKSELDLVQRIKSCDKTSLWANLAWLLERGYGWVARQEITGKDGGALIQTTISKETLAKIAKIAAPEQVKRIN